MANLADLAIGVHADTPVLPIEYTEWPRAVVAAGAVATSSKRGDMANDTQTFTCSMCGDDWSRPTVRGNYPRRCPDCRHRSWSVKQCAGCGTAFHPYRRAANQERHFCSHQCYATSKVLPDEHHRAANAARKASRRTTLREGESFDPREIFERDGWRCGICGYRVGRTYSHPHPRSASLDHIVPLSQGGTHTRVNVQCSHLRCNLSKHATGPGQLLLVG